MTAWTPLLDLDDLAPGALKAVKRDGRQLVLARTDDGEVHALDNRCPHEGYPLASGTLKGCDLTCCWHNWKFDVRDGSCRVGGEAVRAFPARVVAGRVEVDLSEPDPSTFFPSWLESLHEGIARHQNGRALRDAVRLLHGGYDPWMLLAEVARHDADHAEYGSTHALALAADCGRMFDRYPGARAAYALAPAIDMCGEANRLRSARLRPEPLPGADEAALRAAVEDERPEQAEGLLLGAFEAGVPRAEVEGWLYGVLADHFLDFGHPLIYLVKAQELFDRAGDEHAPAVLASLLFSIVYGTREDTLPYMHAHARRFDELPLDVGERPDAPLDAASFRHAVLDAPRADGAMDALLGALRAGVPHAMLARELVVAAAERLLRFDPALDARGDVAENWLFATHRLTFASAVRNAVERWPDPGRARLLAQAVAFLHTGRPMDLAERPATDPEPGDPLEAVRAGDPEAAVRRALHPDLDLEELRPRVEDLVLADPAVRPIVVAHAIKTPLAAFEEAAALGDHPLRALPVAAALRFLASPVRERRVQQAVTTSIEWVVEGKVPRKLTQ